MSRHGARWSIIEVCCLYNLLKAGIYTTTEASEITGRSFNAMKSKAIKGGLFVEDHLSNRLVPVENYPTLMEFLENLRRQRQYELPEIPAKFRKGKLARIFKKHQKRFDGVWSLPVNKRYLIPVLAKWDCKKRHESSNGWWRFAHQAQANPYMRSQLFKREKGVCALCGDSLSEADYQAHHSDYDHVCSYRRSINIPIASNNEIQKIPDCQSCSVYAPEKFASCLKRLHAVHGLCNRRISVDD